MYPFTFNATIYYSIFFHLKCNILFYEIFSFFPVQRIIKENTINQIKSILFQYYSLFKFYFVFPFTCVYFLLYFFFINSYIYKCWFFSVFYINILLYISFILHISALFLIPFFSNATFRNFLKSSTGFLQVLLVPFH